MTTRAQLDVDESDENDRAEDLAATLCDALRELIDDCPGEHVDNLLDTLRGVETFDDAGLLTRDAGVVLRMHDGAEYQLTIVESAHS